MHLAPAKHQSVHKLPNEQLSPRSPLLSTPLRHCRPNAESHIDHGLGFVIFNVTSTARLTRSKLGSEWEEGDRGGRTDCLSPALPKTLHTLLSGNRDEHRDPHSAAPHTHQHEERQERMQYARDGAALTSFTSCPDAHFLVSNMRLQLIRP
jgi:hypothetical protein